VAAQAQPQLLVLGDAPVEVLLGQLRSPAPAAQLVLRLQHLADVVELVLRLDLGRAGRVPVDEAGRVARVVVADDQQNDDHERDYSDRPQ
jgi:hypothetical protein